MTDNSNIDRLAAKLRAFEPDLQNREEMIRDIMEATDNKRQGINLYQLFDSIFSWADYPWVRRGMISVSLVIIFLFSFQQLTIINRIDKLEGRMVQSNTQQLLKFQGENVIMNSVLLIEAGKSEYPDSILVADKDLKELINSYSTLQKRYQELEDSYRNSQSRKVNMQIDIKN